MYSPTMSAAQFPAGPQPPPSPPSSTHEGPLDDIYGSAPTSPVLGSSAAAPAADEILSDLPLRRRMHETDAYREGLAASKGQYVQEGFDEGFSLGANIGQRVGYILGVLQGFVMALSQDEGSKDAWEEVNALYEKAKAELAIQEVLGREWVDEEGVFKWEVHGKEEEVTFREVAAQHPVVGGWMERVKELALQWGVELEAFEEEDAKREEQKVVEF